MESFLGVRVRMNFRYFEACVAYESSAPASPPVREESGGTFSLHPTHGVGASTTKTTFLCILRLILCHQEEVLLVSGSRFSFTVDLNALWTALPQPVLPLSQQIQAGLFHRQRSKCLSAPLS